MLICECSSIISTLLALFQQNALHCSVYSAKEETGYPVVRYMLEQGLVDVNSQTTVRDEISIR